MMAVRARRLRPVKLTISIAGLPEALRKLSKLPKVAQDEIREASRLIADDEADRIVAAGRRAGRQAALAAQSVRSRRDRVPVIVAGGSRRLGTSDGRKVPAGDLFFGAEFGGGARKTTQQFRPHQGTEGYWFWPTLRDDEARIFSQWGKVTEAIARDWGRG